MNAAMRECLVRAVQERAVQVRGKELASHHLEVVLEASFNSGKDGFDRWTLWRALELATENEVENG